MGRTIIVGDVHGCRAELEALLDDVRFTTGDRLVSVGDLVARGPDTLGVLDVMRRTGAMIVRGNHEAKLLAWRAHRGRVTLSRMHRDVARSLRRVDWTLLRTAPLWLDLPEHGVRVVHAGVVPGLPIEEQEPDVLLNIRRTGAHGGALWGELYAGPPHVVFGHNAVGGLQLHAWATGLDTGCVYGGRLTTLVLDDGERVPRSAAERMRRLRSIPAARAYYGARAADQAH